jgi:hypothetical protein
MLRPIANPTKSSTGAATASQWSSRSAGHVAAEHDRADPVPPAGAHLGHHGPGGLSGLQALDLPDRRLHPGRLVVRDDPDDQVRAEVQVVAAGRSPGRGELVVSRRDQQLIEQRHLQPGQCVADLTEQAELLLALWRGEPGVVADQDLGELRADGADVLQPVLAPLQLEPVPAAAFDRHGQDRAVGPRLVDHRLPVALVHQDAGPVPGQLALGPGQAGVDELLGGRHRGNLSRIGPVVTDTEQGPPERRPVIHGHDQQRLRGRRPVVLREGHDLPPVHASSLRNMIRHA